ncbi:MAG: hypothetical protein HQK49_21825 [Oligoflexia bacterium]|nr:hypothetical protein [Oligoflexia bacterium]
MNKIIIFILLLSCILSGCNFLDDDDGVNNQNGNTTTDTDTTTNSTDNNEAENSNNTVPPPVQPPIVEVTPTPTPPTPMAEVVIPIKFHYQRSNYELFKGVMFDVIIPIIDSGKIDNFSSDKDLILPEGIFIDKDIGAIAGIPNKIVSESKTVVWGSDKNGKQKEKVDLTFSIKQIRATDVTIWKDHLCASVSEHEKYTSLGILCWGNLTTFGDLLSEPHFVYYSEEDITSVRMNDNKICIVTANDMKCKDKKEKDFKTILKIDSKASNEIRIGTNHVCALTDSKKIKCWGSNLLGQLGIAPSAMNFSEIPIEVVNSSVEVIEVSAGSNHTCMLNKEDKVYCWGDNSLGQLGISGTKYGLVLIPKILQGDILMVMSMENYSCVVEYKGKVWCWGEMYLNGVKKILSPTEIIGVGEKSYGIALGEEESCVYNDDDIYCWGKNIQGVIKKSRNKIEGSIYAGTGFICVNTSGGSDAVLCSGKNDQGQLGVNKSIKESNILLFALPWSD